MERAVKVLERMENQNTYKELAMDFKVSSKCAKTPIPDSQASSNHICIMLTMPAVTYVCCAGLEGNNPILHALLNWRHYSLQHAAVASMAICQQHWPACVLVQTTKRATGKRVCACSTGTTCQISIGKLKGHCYRSGSSTQNAASTSMSPRCAGTQSTTTCLLWGMAALTSCIKVVAWCAAIA